MTADTAPAPHAPGGEFASPRRRRWPRVVLAVVGLLVLLVLLLPWISASFVRARVLAAVQERFGGKASLGELSLGFGGRVTLRDFQFTDSEGQPCASLAALDVAADVAPLLHGALSADVDVRGLTLHVRRLPDGRLNLEGLPRAAEATTSADASSRAALDSAGSPTPTQLPELRVKLHVQDAAFFVHAASGTTELRDVSLQLDLQDVDRPAPFVLDARLAGPPGAGGALHAEGSVTLAHERILDPDKLLATLQYTLQDLVLACLAPALQTLAPGGMSDVTGTLAGSGEWTFTGPRTLAGHTELGLDGLTLRDAALGEAPVSVPATKLVASASTDAEGTGRQELRLTAGDLLQLTWQGDCRRLALPGGELSGTLNLDARLGAWLALLRAPLGLKPGLDVAGTLTAKSDVKASFDVSSLRSLQLGSELGLTGLAARDARGAALDLHELTPVTASLAGSLDVPQGRFDLARLQLSAGPVQASAHGAVTGLPSGAAPSGASAARDLSRVQVADSELVLDADLDRLARALAPLMELPQSAWGGRLHVRSTARTEGGRVEADADARTTALRVTGADGGALALPDVDLHARASWDGAAGVLDVPELAVTSDLASGGITLRVSRLAASSGLPAVKADVTLQGEAEAARAFASAFVPGLAAARAQGRWTLKLAADTEGTLTHARPSLVLSGLSLDGYRVGDQVLPLRDADVTLSGELELDSAGTGVADLKALVLQAPGLDLSAAGHGSGFLATPAAPRATLQATVKLQPRELSERLGAFLLGVQLGGEALDAQLAVGVSSNQLSVRGGATSPAFELRLPAQVGGAPARTLRQQDLSLDLDVDADLAPGKDHLALNKVHYASRTAELALSGTVDGLTQPAGASADVKLTASTPLQRLLADAGELLPLSGWSGTGAIALQASLHGNAGQLALVSRTTLDDLSLRIPRAPATVATTGDAGNAGNTGNTGNAGAGSSGATAVPTEPLLIEDKHAQIDVKADIASGPLDIALQELRIASASVRGTVSGRLLGLRALLAPADVAAPAAARVEGLTGELTYVPERLGALLAPLLPGEWRGAQEETVTFRLDGPLVAGDARALLSGLTGNAKVGLGELALPGLALSGHTALDLEGARAHVTGQLGLNGGTADIEALLDLGAGAAAGLASASAGTSAPAGAASVAPVSHLKLKVAGVQVTQEMGSVLSRIHPLLAVNDKVGTASGAIGADIDVEWRAPLPLGGGGATPPLTALSGTGRIDFGTLKLASSPLLGKMLGNLGLAPTTQLAIQPASLAVKDGRVTYTEPWTWNIKDVATTFTGSMGLDQTLDLSWNVPVTDALVAQHGFLQRLKGQSLSVPIRGSVSAPDLQWTAALEQLGQDALQNEIQGRLGDKLGPLGGLLGGKDEKGEKGAKPGGAESGAAAVTPEALLAQADALWDKGQKEESKPLYKQLRTDFKLTLTYQLNKKRIDERAKWKP